ncbi:MAG TPA: polyphosphate kinase 2 family protein [Gemmataceae bacterium]|nr:polyphosphate kinase 2 family protein [Gemmataceae bacterium]
MIKPEIIDLFRIPPGTKVKLKQHDTGWAQTDELKEAGKDEVRARAEAALAESQQELTAAQELLYADNRYAILVILQGLDAAGKDGTIKHVMSGLNPQGCEVYGFKQPSHVELDHTFLWRYARVLPERGRIGIFNRSYYEDVLVVKVHPEILAAQQWPRGAAGKKFWKHRYEDINSLERHLTRNGTVVLKFFLHMSKEEQKKRLLERLENPEKHWKFSLSDLAERKRWGEYIDAFEDCISATSTEWAPWYVIPADKKWVARALVANILVSAIRGLDLSFPKVTAEQHAALARAREQLSKE